jgi:hypothetical protein
MTGTTLALQRAVRRLTERLEALESRLEGDASATWDEYRDTAAVLSNLLERFAPGRHGALLTTAQMAERLGVAPKTLLRRKKAGDIRPAVQRGKLIRWRGNEMPN